MNDYIYTCHEQHFLNFFVLKKADFFKISSQFGMNVAKVFMSYINIYVMFNFRNMNNPQVAYGK